MMCDDLFQPTCTVRLDLARCVFFWGVCEDEKRRCSPRRVETVREGDDRRREESERG